jgi:ABC-2 type transport system ATP-binding protein
VLISSHILSELRQLCNKIAIIDRGKLIYSGTINAALEMARTVRRIEVRLAERGEEAAALLSKRSEVAGCAIEDGHIALELVPDAADHGFVAECLVQNGFRILTLREEEILLEDAFMKLTQHQGENETAGA